MDNVFGEFFTFVYFYAASQNPTERALKSGDIMNKRESLQNMKHLYDSFHKFSEEAPKFW